jgi:hypothetical protein
MVRAIERPQGDHAADHPANRATTGRMTERLGPNATLRMTPMEEHAATMALGSTNLAPRGTCRRIEGASAGLEIMGYGWQYVPFDG